VCPENFSANLSSSDLSGNLVGAGEPLIIALDDQGNITDDTRIAALPTIQDLMQKMPKSSLASHFGRPKVWMTNCLTHRCQASQITWAEVVKCDDVRSHSKVAAMQNGRVLLLENVRFHKEEEK